MKGPNMDYLSIGVTLTGDVIVGYVYIKKEKYSWFYLKYVSTKRERERERQRPSLPFIQIPYILKWV